MEFLAWSYAQMDALLIYAYRLPDSPVLGYVLGTLVLCAACVAVGELSMSVAFFANKKNIERDCREIERFEGLSVEALKAGDRDAFSACNGIANETYGKGFFMRVALAAASLWPAFMALGWMQYRFSGVQFGLPLWPSGAEATFGYLPTFIASYVAVRIAFARLRHLRFMYR